MTMLIQLDNSDSNTIHSILRSAGLPTADLKLAHWLVLVGWKSDYGLVGIGGLEKCDDCLLLRSVAVNSEMQGQGIGTKVVSQLHEAGKGLGYKEVYLLTMDMDDYFSTKFGYRIIKRENTPEGIRNSAQFSGLCPDSAWVMKKSLEGSQ